MYHKSLNNQLPAYFSNLNFNTNNSRHNYGLRNNDQLFWGGVDTTHYLRNSIEYNIINIHNTLPVSVSSQFSKSLVTFSKLVKNIFLSTYDPVCSLPQCFSCNYKGQR